MTFPLASFLKAGPLAASFQRLREHFPFTLQGLATLALLLLALQVFGYGAMDLVVFALTICAVAILLFSLFCVIAGGLFMQYRLHRSGSPPGARGRTLRLEAGFPNETGFTLPEPAYFPLIRISWQVIFPDYLQTRIRPAADSNLLAEEVVPLRRCRAARVTRLFTVSDVLGFCRYQWRQSQALELTVLPRSNSIRALPLLRSLTTEDGVPNLAGNPEGDRVEIRPYVPGDSVRNIMWKVYARNRELNVRLPERSVFQSNRTVAYLLSGPGDEAAAAVARAAVETGALGEDWLFGADGTDTPAHNEPDKALEAIAASRALGDPLGYGLDRFLQNNATQGAGHCIVFSPAHAGPWVAQLRQTVGRYRGRISLVLATDGFTDTSPASPWRKLLLRSLEERDQAGHAVAATDRYPARVGKSDLGRLLTEISQLVESTFVVDRNTGQSFDSRLRRL